MPELNRHADDHVTRPVGAPESTAVLSTNLRVTGYDAVTWLRLVSLFEPPRVIAASGEVTPQGLLVIVEDEAGRGCAGFIADRGSIPTVDYHSRADLKKLCERHRARRGVAMRQGTIEAITERAAEQVLRTDDYAVQWLAIWAATRELERDGALYFWPERQRVPVPSPQMITRAIDMLLPDERSFVAVLWDETEVWTALVLRRRAGQIDLIGGPELVQEIAGPLGGDFRRDQRAVSRAIGDAIAPVQLGLYAQRRRFERLLRDAEPGAWAKAIALRDVIIDPSPAYVHVAVGADALRATARRTSRLLGGIDLMSYIEPAARYAREQIANVSSVTNMLGFNPLQLLARKLRASEEVEPVPDGDPNPAIEPPPADQDENADQ
jgi:hypothetical protein